jgi:hypothetical protein
VIARRTGYFSKRKRLDLLVNWTPATANFRVAPNSEQTELGSSAGGRFEGDRVTLAGLSHPQCQASSACIMTKSSAADYPQRAAVFSRDGDDVKGDLPRERNKPAEFSSTWMRSDMAWTRPTFFFATSTADAS